MKNRFKLKRIIGEHGLLLGILITPIKAFHKAIFSMLSFFLYKNIKINPKQIIFYSKRDFSDNARALFDYLIENKYDEKNRIVWLVSEPGKFSEYKNDNILFIKSKTFYNSYTLRALFYVRTSKLFFFTHSPFMLKAKKSNQLFINLWHGSGYKAAKAGGGEIYFDYCLVPGKVFIETKKEFFKCSGDKILPLGYPRYDWFKKASPLTREYLNRFGEDKASKVKNIIWMPTFRKSTAPNLSENTLVSDFDIPLVSSQKELIKIDKFCRENNINLLIKQHFLQVGYDLKDSPLSNIFLITDEDLDKHNIQLYELLALTDGLITDYSSVAIDFLLMDRPIGFVLEDFEKYKKSRGFVFENPLDYMPGHHIYTLENLFIFLDDTAKGIDKHEESRKKVRAKTHNETDNYSRRIIEQLTDL